MDNTWREIIAEWQGETSFIGKNASGGTVQMGKINDQPGISPMELLLVGLAGCTGMDIASILQKQRVTFDDLKVQVRAKRATDYPMVFTEIVVTYMIWGNDIDSRSLERAIHLSEEKYCSVGLMLSKAASITSSYHIYQPEEKIAE